MMAMFAAAGLIALLGCATARRGGPTASVGGEAAGRFHVCASCHGDAGVSRAELFPNLAGQQKDYIVAQLTAFRDHTRADRDAKSYMWGMAAGLDDATMLRLAAYYSAQPPASPASGAKSEVAAGEAIFKNGVPDSGVLACASCHGDRGEGNGVVPRLAGQHADYIKVQLTAFASGARDNATMNLVAKAMTPAQMRAVAAYLSSSS